MWGNGEPLHLTLNGHRLNYYWRLPAKPVGMHLKTPGHTCPTVRASSWDEIEGTRASFHTCMYVGSTVLYGQDPGGCWDAIKMCKLLYPLSMMLGQIMWPEWQILFTCRFRVLIRVWDHMSSFYGLYMWGLQGRFKYYLLTFAMKTFEALEPSHCSQWSLESVLHYTVDVAKNWTELSASLSCWSHCFFLCNAVDVLTVTQVRSPSIEDQLLGA